MPILASTTSPTQFVLLDHWSTPKEVGHHHVNQHESPQFSINISGMQAFNIYPCTSSVVKLEDALEISQRIVKRIESTV
jgi:hypothetical protein